MASRLHERPTVAVATAPATWSSFVDRFGVTAVAGLVAAIAARIVAFNAGLDDTEGAGALQLLFVLVMLGCIAVLAFRDGDTTP